ncbi:MAG: hypothetical protein GF315_02455 [candidate division Zixibacteria bacterium]|nr:hypothetical protein [candidate division Zixibacteria bacterium]
MNLEIKIIDSFEKLEGFENEWRDFEKYTQHRNLTASYDWIKTWWDCFGNTDSHEFGNNKQLLIILLYRDENLRAIAPFTRLTRNNFGVPISYVEFIGQQWGGTYLDIISENISEEEINYIIQWLYNNIRFDFLQLKYIPEDSILYSPHQDEMEYLSGCPEFRLSEFGSYDDYKSSVYSKKLKQNIRTAHNHIKKSGMEYSESAEEINPENLDKIIHISGSKVGDDKVSIYEDPKKREFLRHILNRLKSDVMFIKLNGYEVSYRVNVYFNGVKFCLDAAYNRFYKKQQVGSLSVDYSIRHSYDNLDWIQWHCEGTGMDFYKTKYIKTSRNIYTHVCKGNTIKSYLINKLDLKKLGARHSRKGVYRESVS